MAAVTAGRCFNIEGCSSQAVCILKDSNLQAAADTALIGLGICQISDVSETLACTTSI